MRLTLDVLRVIQELDVRLGKESTVLVVSMYGEEVKIPVSSRVMEHVVQAVGGQKGVEGSEMPPVTTKQAVAYEPAPQDEPAFPPPPETSPETLRERARNAKPRRSVDESGFGQG